MESKAMAIFSFRKPRPVKLRNMSAGTGVLGWTVLCHAERLYLQRSFNDGFSYKTFHIKDLIVQLKVRLRFFRYVDDIKAIVAN